MQNIKITVTDTDQRTRSIQVEVNPSENLMTILKDADFDVPGSCGGMAACGTCHIAVLAGTISHPVDEEEEDMVADLANAKESSRLACQVPITADLDGLKIEVVADV